MSVRKSSHGTIFLIVSSGSPRALIASSLRSTSKKPFCPMTRSLHPPMTAHGHRVRFVATWREEFFEVPRSHLGGCRGTSLAHQDAYRDSGLVSVFLSTRDDRSGSMCGRRLVDKSFFTLMRSARRRDRPPSRLRAAC